MLKFLIQSLSNLSARFNWNLSRLVTEWLHPVDRRSILLEMLRRDEVEEVTFRRNGTTWTGKTRDIRIMPCLFLQGGFQVPEIENLLAWLQNPGRLSSSRQTIVDVGANLGTSSIPLAQRTDCHVLAIEPVPENFQLLQRNVEQNDLADRITCARNAVHQRATPLEMVVPKENSGGAFVNTGDLSPVGESAKSEAIYGRVTATATPLTGLLAAHGFSPEEIALVWCDAEGSEVDVIETGAPLWNLGVPLYMELNPEALARQECLGSIEEVVTTYFDRYIPSRDLIEQRKGAATQSMEGFAVLLDALSEKREVDDVLLLPRSFPCE